MDGMNALFSQCCAGPCVVAAGDRDESARDLPAVAVEREHLGEDVVGVAAPLVARLERDARLLRDLRHRLALGDGERHRLLAEHVLAGLHRGDRDDGVPVGLPAFIAAMAMMACQWSGVQMQTASMVGSAITSRQSNTSRHSLSP